MSTLKSQDQTQISIIKERILTNLQTHGMSSYDLLKQSCKCNRGDFAVAMRQLLRQSSIIRDKQQGEYRIN
jgi:hypothetical protein